MLSDLTSNPLADLAPGSGGLSAMAKRKRGLVTPQSRRSSLASSNLSSTSRTGGSSSRGRRPPVPSAGWTVRDYEETEAAGGSDEAAGDDGYDGGGALDMEDDYSGVVDDGGQFDDKIDHAMEQDADEGKGGEKVTTTTRATITPAGSAAEADSEKDNKTAGDGKRIEDFAVVSPDGPAASSATSASGDAAASPGAGAAAKPRSRFARMKETNHIAVTAAAEAVLKPKPKPGVGLAGRDVADAASKADGKAGDGGGKGGSRNYVPSLDFHGPQYALNESTTTPSAAAPSTSSWLQTVGIPLVIENAYSHGDDDGGTCVYIFKTSVSSIFFLSP